MKDWVYDLQSRGLALGGSYHPGHTVQLIRDISVREIPGAMLPILTSLDRVHVILDLRVLTSDHTAYLS